METTKLKDLPPDTIFYLNGRKFYKYIPDSNPSYVCAIQLSKINNESSAYIGSSWSFDGESEVQMDKR